MRFFKYAIGICILLLFISCTVSNFDKNVIKAFQSSDFDYLIENSIPAIAQQLKVYQLAHGTEGNYKGIKFKKKIRMHENKWELILYEENNYYLSIQYEVVNNKPIIFFVEYSKWR